MYIYLPPWNVISREKPCAYKYIQEARMNVSHRIRAVILHCSCIFLYFYSIYYSSFIAIFTSNFWCHENADKLPWIYKWTHEVVHEPCVMGISWYFNYHEIPMNFMALSWILVFSWHFHVVAIPWILKNFHEIDMKVIHRKIIELSCMILWCFEHFSTFTFVLPALAKNIPLRVLLYKILDLDPSNKNKLFNKPVASSTKHFWSICDC